MAGALDTVTLRQGTGTKVVTDYDYDVLNRLDFETIKKVVGTVPTLLETFDYHVTSDGSRDWALESDYTAGTLSGVIKTTWTYDALDRLTKETHDVGNNGLSAGDYTDSYTLDLVGNRLTKVHDDFDPALVETITDRPLLPLLPATPRCGPLVCADHLVRRLTNLSRPPASPIPLAPAHPTPDRRRSPVSVHHRPTRDPGDSVPNSARRIAS